MEEESLCEREKWMKTEKKKKKKKKKEIKTLLFSCSRNDFPAESKRKRNG
jgi:hypothetical protein